jgi:hypothetical protein
VESNPGSLTLTDQLEISSFPSLPFVRWVEHAPEAHMHTDRAQPPRQRPNQRRCSLPDHGGRRDRRSGRHIMRFAVGKRSSCETPPRGPLTAHRSPLTAHRSPLTTDQRLAPLTAHRMPSAMHTQGRRATNAPATRSCDVAEAFSADQFGLTDVLTTRSVL